MPASACWFACENCEKGVRLRKYGKMRTYMITRKAGKVQILVCAGHSSAKGTVSAVAAEL